MSDDLMEVRRERPDLANDRDALIAAADENGLFVCGLDKGLPHWGLA